MSNPNMTTVFDKNGEPFEMNKANARDLVEHAGWSFQKPTVIEKIVEVPAKEEKKVEDEQAEDEKEVEEISDSTVSASHADNTAEEQPLRHMEDFGDYETREDMVEYLAKFFPDFKPHHKAGRDSLVEKAVELANG